MPRADKRYTGYFTVEDRMSASSMLQGQIALLLQQQLIGQLQEYGDTLSLTEALLRQRRAKSGRETMAEAITGRIRSDSGTLRQSARNLREGGDIANIAHTGVSSIVESLEKMLKLAQDTAAGSAGSGAADAYAAHAESIQNTVKNTAYNGISLMDRTQWATDERVSVSSSGSAYTGSIGIQAGKGMRTVTMTDFSDMAGGSTLNATLDAGNANDLASELSVLINNMKMHEKSYGQLGSSLESEAKSIERQSRILDLSATRTIAGAGTDPASKLLFFLLSEQGKLIDSKG